MTLDASSNDDPEPPLLPESPILEVDSTTNTLDPTANPSPQGQLVGLQGETVDISDLMRADLYVLSIVAKVLFTFPTDFLGLVREQLYFDRVHEFAPILHRRRYFSWARQPIKSEPQTCLQYSMWTLAASLSTQFQHIRDSLYTVTKQTLEAMELNNDQIEPLTIEQAQAWVLVTIYEFTRVSYRRGWLSAGRLFRLVQLMRIYEIDGPGTTAPSLDCMVLEEKRRVFWIAYLLDRLVSIPSRWPLTLNEQMVSTRLPASEMDFQSSKPFQMNFLSEVMLFSEHTTLSLFTKSIVIATICGRTMAHQQQSNVECVYQNVTEDFWNRHHWLDTMLTQQELIISIEFPSALEHVDPTMLFIDMMVHTTVLYLHNIVESMPWKGDEYQEPVLEYQRRTLTAVVRINTLTKSLSQLSCFKVSLLLLVSVCVICTKYTNTAQPKPSKSRHYSIRSTCQDFPTDQVFKYRNRQIHPFTPILLFLYAEFLHTHTNLDESLRGHFQDILKVFQELKNVNNLAENFLKDLNSKA